MRPFALGACVVLASLAAASPAAHAAPPDGRAYELVSPVEKNGAEVGNGLQASADGDAVAYLSTGAFGDVASDVLQTYYVSRRGTTAWTTKGLTPPPAVRSPAINDLLTPADFSADLQTLYLDAPATTPLAAGDADTALDAYASTGDAAAWLSPGLALPDTSANDSVYAGRSDDGRHVVLESSKQLLAGVPDDGIKRVYERVDGALRLVSVPPPSATPFTGPAAFGGGRVSTTDFAPEDRRAVSADGRRIFFTATNADGQQLYVREDGAQTRLISASHRTDGSAGTPAASAPTFMGASDDGSRVVFTDASPLTDDATHGGLYVYDLDHDALTLLADVDPADGAILGVAHTAPDGRRTFFVADAALSGAAQAGQPNLYAAGDTGVRYIATLAAGDSAAWSHGENGNTSSISEDGRRLAFTSTRDVTGSPHGSFTEVYVYDAGAGQLACASCPPGGGAATGNAALRETSSTTRIQPRSFTTGGRLFFETPQALVPGDVNAKSDVYEYDAGRGVQLISPGTGTGAHLVDNSVDGRDVFLRTNDALTPDDADGGYADVYDARVGGGLPRPPAPCSGEACRGPIAPAGPAGPASGSLTAFDVSGPAPPAATAPTFRVTPISAAARRAWAHTSRLTLSVRVSAEAVVKARARAAIGRHQATVATAAAGRTSAGTLHLTLKLSRTAHAALRRHGRLTVRLTITCSDTPKTAHATVVLTAARRKAGR